MIKANFSEEEKQKISNAIKPISLQKINKEYNELLKIGKNSNTMSDRCRIGNNIVDYFTFRHRLETRGKYDASFYDFLANIDEFKKKKFIKTMLTYYENVKNKNKTKNEYVVMKEVYNICISAINIIRPLVYMEIYSKYKPTTVLDFCAGWGGAVVAASVLNIEKYIGIELNKSLEEPYNKLLSYVKEKGTKTEIEMYFKDALEVDYSQLEYDLVFTSPPYYFIQKYQENPDYNGSKREMDENFYIPVFTKVYNGLKPGGHLIINVCKEVYDNVLFKLFGEPNEIYPYKKSKRQNDYKEIVYVWKKIII